MANAMVNFRMDEGLKAGMEETCSKMGISMTAAFTMFATKVVREQRIPFEVTADPFYNENNVRFLREGMMALNAGRGVEHELIEEEE